MQLKYNFSSNFRSWHPNIESKMWEKIIYLFISLVYGQDLDPLVQDSDKLILVFVEEFYLADYISHRSSIKSFAWIHLPYYKHVFIVLSSLTCEVQFIATEWKGLDENFVEFQSMKKWSVVEFPYDYIRLKSHKSALSRCDILPSWRNLIFKWKINTVIVDIWLSWPLRKVWEREIICLTTMVEPRGYIRCSLSGWRINPLKIFPVKPMTAFISSSYSIFRIKK